MLELTGAALRSAVGQATSLLGNPADSVVRRACSKCRRSCASISRQPSSTLYVTTLMNGDVMIARAASRSSSACTCVTASWCCSTKRWMISAAMSLVEGCALGGEVNFRAALGACERINIRPRTPGRTGKRCQRVRGPALFRAASAAWSIRRFAVSKCSKHCATLHRVASGRQFSCRVSKPPNVACVS